MFFFQKRFTAGLWQRVEDYDGLVSAGHDSFGDGDQFVLLAKDAETRRARVSAVELSGGAGRRLDAARLDLRDGNIKF